MEATDPGVLAAPTIKGRLRRRPIGPILRVRAIMSGIIALVIMTAGAMLITSLVFHSPGSGFGDLPSKPGLLVQIWPAYVIAALAWLASRGFRDRRTWALLLALLVGVGLVAGALLLISVAMTPVNGKPIDGNVAFGLFTLAGLFLVLGLPLFWNLIRGIGWFTDREALLEIRTADSIRAEQSRIVAAGGPAAVTPARPKDEPLVSVRGLKKHFPIMGGVLRRQVGTIYAVDGVDFDVIGGEVFSVVGESGCGKTTLGRTLLQLTPSTAGHVVFDGYELADVDPDDMRPLRRRMQIIFQDPFGSLNPRMPISDIIGEGLLAQGISNRKERDQRVGDALELVGLRRAYTRRYPHEFSGGQRQRIGVARALALNPQLIILDEPVSALDVSIRAQVVNLLESLQRDFGLTYIFVAHDLSVVRHVSDRVAVMYLGKVVEIGTKHQIYDEPSHPYTQALLSAVPIEEPSQRGKRKRIVLEGDVPSPANPPSGCRFRTRCWKAQPICSEEEPALIDRGQGHPSACHFAEIVKPLDIVGQPVSA
jgi:oligopeptide/dipeptide ABC transporter ATP-binding protein